MRRNRNERKNSTWYHWLAFGSVVWYTNYRLYTLRIFEGTYFCNRNRRRGIGRRLFVPAQTAAADIARGHGGIVAWQGKKYGVYRHTDGTLFAVDIRCPHRGCELTWNDDEKSWDCPCHGSRFDYTGHRLSEPAKAALKPCKDFPQEI